MGKDEKKTASKEELSPEEERGEWANPAEFILSCLGYAVGLGNVWRFPYMCYENGGGAFLIPYAIMLTFVGLPVFFIELSVGQYSGKGPLDVFGAASPLFQGVGMGMLIISFIGCIYYNMIIGWSLYYMFASFQRVLPWSRCDHDFNTESCYSVQEAKPCEAENGIWFNRTCFNETYIDSMGGGDGDGNDTINMFREMLVNESKKLTSSSEEYFNYGMLDRSDRIEDSGYVKWDLALVLLLAWILCFVCILKGIKSSGKVVYFTATFPYLVLLILFFRGVTLPGALEGIKFYIIPKWELLAKPKVWADAAGQIFFSLSVGMGGLMTFASYNKFHNNVYRDTLIVTIGNCLTSFFAGFVIFSIIGYMAHELNASVEDVVDSGSGLAFVAYPQVVTMLPVSQLWSILFFFMLLTLGLDSQFAGLENLQTALIDRVPKLRPYKHFVAASLCAILYLLGLTMCTRAGVYWTDLMGYYSSGWSLVLIGLAEATVFPWVYGARRLQKDIEYMVGFKLGPHWWICWTFISPILLIAILIFNIIDFTPLSFGDYVMPPWAQGLGWLMAVASVIMIIAFAIFHIVRSYQDPEFEGLSFLQRIVKLTKPNEDWKPSFERYGTAASPGDTESPPSYNAATNGTKQNYENPAFDQTAVDTRF